jgi:hypothetical protein
MPSVKQAIKPFIDEFEKIGSQTASQAVQAVKKIAGDAVIKPIQEVVGNPVTGVASAGTNEDQSAANVQFQQQMAKVKQDDAARTQNAMAQVRQNLKALMTPKQKLPDKPVYYKMWDDMEKKKQEKQEEIIKKNEESADVKAAGKSTGEMKKGIGG